MTQDIKYKGYTASPNDRDAQDGELSMAMNLVNEGGAIRPIELPRVEFTIPDGYTVIALHKTANYTHYIMHNAQHNALAWTDGNTVNNIAGDFSNGSVRSVETVGNTLVVLADDGLHYILWDVEKFAYRYLGQKPPRVDITFGLSSKLVAYPGYKVDGSPNEPVEIRQPWESVDHVSSDNATYITIPKTLMSNKSGYGGNIFDKHRLMFVPQSQLPSVEQYHNTVVWGGGDFSMKDSSEDGARQFVETATNFVMGAVNKLITTEGQEKGRFVMPFFVRYAYRMYDGSMVMHSYPVLMIPNSRGPFFALNGCAETGSPHKTGMYFQVWYPDGDYVYISDFTLRGRAYAFASQLCYDAKFPDLSDWSDLIQSVDVYVSAPCYTINQDEKVYGWKNMEGQWDSFYTVGKLENADNSTFSKWKVSDVFKADMQKAGQPADTLYEPFNHTNGDDMPSYVMTVSEPSKDEMMRRLTDVANFYKIHSFTVGEDFKGDHSVNPLSGVIELKDGELKALVAREQLNDDFYTRDIITAERSFAYNGRINLTGITRTPHKPLDASITWAKYTHRPNEAARCYDTAFRIPNADRVNMITSGPGRNDTPHPLFIWYPDPAATTVTVTTGTGMRQLKLKAHPFLYGAFWLGDIWDGDDDWQNKPLTFGAFPADDFRPVNERSKVYTSEVNNPFFFPATGINTVGTGDIIGVCAAVKALSQGQFGQHPLYAFTSDGVWALQTNEHGGYSAVQPVTRDVCTSADSITQLDDAVVFNTARGIMLIGGSEVICLTEAIDDLGMDIGSMDEKATAMAAMLGIGDVTIAPFRDFLHGCRTLYDYRHQRIIAYNTGYNYAYVYSLSSKQWGMMRSTILYGVKSYPDALAVIRDGVQQVMANFCEPAMYGDGTVAVDKGLLITRPLDLGDIDVLKTVSDATQRGLFRKHQGHVQSVLYGSRDLFNWHLVMSSTDENMRGCRGTPYKWYRVALLLRLPSGESIEGCSIQYDTKYTNRLR